ncbi:MAG: PAS domain S-box protein, partial [Anaerolineales bacterium]|nr:PAS domain S-box protein [Anaerolineales bacterium]
MLTRIKTFLAPPHFENDENNTRLAVLINFFVRVIFLCSLFFSLVWIITSPELAVRVIFATPIFLFSVIAFILLKRKRIYAAGMSIVGGLWIVLVVSAWFSGGIHAPATSGFTVVVLLAALVLGRKTAVGFAGLSILTSLGLVLGESQGIISGHQFSTPFAIWASYTSYLVVAAILLHMATHNIQEALARAQQEIEERKRTEAALREAELRYRTLVEHLPVVTYRDTPNLEATPLYISPQIEKLLGVPPHAWLDSPTFWQTLVHPDDLSRVMKNIQTYIVGGQSSSLEYRLKRQDGQWVWVRDEANLLKDEDGIPLFVQGTLSDITEQKTTEQALRASQDKFNKAFEFSPYPMYISSPTRGFIEVNESFLKMLGRSRNEVLGKHALEFTFWASPEEQNQALTTLLRDGWLRDFEFHFRKKSGEIGIGLTSAAALSIDEEICALGSVFDLTQRKKAEEALRISEDKFQKAFQFSPIAMAISSPTRGYLDINDAFAKITGYSRAETLGRFSADIQLWPDQAYYQKIIKTIEKTGFMRDIEIEFRRKNGEIGITLASAVIIDFEQERCLLASLYDITDRKQNEEALRTSEDKFQKAFLSSPVSMMINSPTRGILNVNQAFEELTGFQRAEILGKHAHEAGLWVNLEERQTSINLVRQYGALHDFEFHFRKKDGRIRVGSLAVDLIEIDGEECYLASFQDITTRKEVEETLRNMNTELEARVQNRTAQLEAANRELESFSYSISHDLRAPLRAINGFSRLILEEYTQHLPPEAQRLQNLVQENALKMARLIDDLLAFSRLGRSPLQMRPLPLENLVNEVWQDLAHERGTRQIVFLLRPLPPVL